MRYTHLGNKGGGGVLSFSSFCMFFCRGVGGLSGGGGFVGGFCLGDFCKMGFCRGFLSGVFVGGFCREVSVGGIL